MAESIPCICGKLYKWKPELAGKRARCKCGQTVTFPLEAVASDPFESFEEPDAPQEAPVAPKSTAAPSRTFSALWAGLGDGASKGPSLAQKLLMLSGSLLGLGIFAGWPMMEMLQGEHSITVSFKAILLCTMMTMISLNLLLLGDKGIPWTRGPNSPPVTILQKAIMGATFAAGLALAGLVWLFFHLHGYSF